MQAKKEILSKINEKIARLKHLGSESEVLNATGEIRKDSCCILMSE